MAIHDDFNTNKMCNYANPTHMRFMHMYEPCVLVTRDVFYVTFHRDSQRDIFAGTVKLCNLTIPLTHDCHGSFPATISLPK